jgi:hypothetical protein
MFWLVAQFKRINAFYQIINKSAIEKILLNTQSGTGHCYFCISINITPLDGVCVCVDAWL